MKRVLTSLLSLALLSSASSQASAWTPIDGSKPHWKNLPVVYKVNQSTIPASISGIGVARVDAGFQSWAAPSCTMFQAQDGGDTNTTRNNQDGINTVWWKTGSWPAQLGDVNSVIGVTEPVWLNDGGFIDADITFNHVGFQWDDSGSSGDVDTQSIATHEEGHFLGLGHTNANGATMEPSYGGGTALRSIEQDDINGVCALYPSGGNPASAAASSSASGGGTCQDCANSSTMAGCSSQYQSCGGDQDCVDFSNCLQNCQNQSCVDQCTSAHQQGAQVYSQLIQCICMVCSNECSQECGSGSSASTSASAATSTAASADAVATSAAGTGGASGSGDFGTATGAGGAPSQGKSGPSVNENSSCAVAPGGRMNGMLGLFGVVATLGIARRRRRR